MGLGIGLGCSILMITYILHEFTYDSYHTKSSRIFRIALNGDNCSTPHLLGETIKNDIPGVESVFRIKWPSNAKNMKLKY
jgi:putative ABC transport system permease protein